MAPAANTGETIERLRAAVSAAEGGMAGTDALRDALPRERRWHACRSVVQEQVRLWIETEGQAGVAPALLAQVYPSLLAQGQRKERGVYFTDPRLAAATAARVLAPLLAGSPRTLHVVDPAAGGGVFLLAALGQLQRSLQRSPAELLAMLQGTDLDPVAAMLANLALWQAAGDTSIDPWSVRCVQAGDGLAEGREGTMDAVLGNPPWETWQPSRDELSRELGDEAAVQREWQAASARRAGTASDLRTRFAHQGRGKLFTYRLFLERSLQLLRAGGRLGLVLPAALYSDREAAPLRTQLLDHCSWEWLFAFENRRRIFPIDSRYRFAVVVAQKGGSTHSLRAAFHVHDVAAWARPTPPHLEFDRTCLRTLSPRHGVVPELHEPRDRDLLVRMHGGGTALLDGSRAWFKFAQGDFNMTADAHEFVAPSAADKDRHLPLLQGAMVDVLQPVAAHHASSHGARASWRAPDSDALGPQHLVSRDAFGQDPEGPPRLVLRALSNATNERTLVPCLVPRLPCGNSLVVLEPTDGTALPRVLRCAAAAGILASFSADWAARRRLAGTNLNRFVLGELPFPSVTEAQAVAIARIALRLCLGPRHQQSLARHAMIEGWLDDSSPPTEAPHRTRLFAALEHLVAAAYGLSANDLRWILRDTQHPVADLARPAFTRTLDSRGFWRVDRTLHPEARLPAAILAAHP